MPLVPSMPANVSIVAIRGWRSLSVPVLSNTMRSARARTSSASPRSASTPRRASAPCAAASAAGTASDSAQGQLTTSTASATSNARAGSCIRHHAYTAIAARISTVTNHPAMRSAVRAIGGRCSCARSTSRVSCDSRVSAPVRSTCSRAGRSRQRLPAQAVAPAVLATGSDSPVSRDSSNAVSASSTAPSAGTPSPTATRTMSPTASAFSGTCSALPSARSRVASAGRARASASTCADAIPRARCSSMRATSSRKTNITAASYQTWVPPRTVSNRLAKYASRVEPAISVSMPRRRPRSSRHIPSRNGQPA